MAEWELKDGLANMPKGRCFIITPPMFQAGISGAYKAAFWHDGRVGLRYADDTIELVKMPVDKAQEIAENGLDNWFSIVPDVQGQRPNTTMTTASEMEAKATGRG